MNVSKLEKSLPLPKRLRTKVQVYCGAEENLSVSNFITKSVDLSEGGLFLQTERSIAIGQIILLRFYLTDTDKPLTCKAKVAWANDAKNPCKPQFPPGVGVEFQDVSVNDRNAIAQYVRNMSGRSF